MGLTNRPLASRSRCRHTPALCAPAQVDASDAGSPPAGYVRFPWHIAASLALAYLFGYFGWHWSFVAAVFWLASNVEASRQRSVWAELKELASAAAARDWERVLSHHRDRQQPSRGEPVHWLNRAIKECWPYYVARVSEYTRNVLLEPALTKYLPISRRSPVDLPPISRQSPADLPPISRSPQVPAEEYLQLEGLLDLDQGLLARRRAPPGNE